jgi:hypothetical protein
MACTPRARSRGFGRCICSLLALGDARRSCLASDFVVLVLSEAVLSETVLVLDGYLNCGNSVSVGALKGAISERF